LCATFVIPFAGFADPLTGPFPDSLVGVFGEYYEYSGMFGPRHYAPGEGPVIIIANDGVYETTGEPRKDICEGEEVLYSNPDTVIILCEYTSGRWNWTEYYARISSNFCVITSTSPDTVVQGNVYKYPLTAIANNNDSLGFSLLYGPEGMTCSKDGYISWRTDNTELRYYDVGVRATCEAEADTQLFTITVIHIQDTMTVLTCNSLVASKLPAPGFEAGSNLTFKILRVSNGFHELAPASGYIKWGGYPQDVS
jgi:hypothetical protein